MAIYMTSDHHFGHQNIIQFCERPIVDVPHMIEMLIQYWNETVGVNDDVY